MSSQGLIQSNLWFGLEAQPRLRAGFKRTVAVSLVGHVIVFSIVLGLKAPRQSERIVTSVEVSLVSEPTSVRQVGVASTLVPTQKVAPTPVVKLPQRVERAAPLRARALPPDISKRGNMSPVKSVAQSFRDAKVTPHAQSANGSGALFAKTFQRSLASDDLKRELEEELQKVKQLHPAAKLEVPSETTSRETLSQAVASQQMTSPALKIPDMTLKIGGTSGVVNPYWARVQSIISSHWEPPPIDQTRQIYTVTLQFRLARNGTIKNVVITQSSGNTYFDLSGQRAVLRSVMPTFPADMPHDSIDVEMAFRVGESAE